MVLCAATTAHDHVFSADREPPLISRRPRGGSLVSGHCAAHSAYCPYSLLAVVRRRWGKDVRDTAVSAVSPRVSCPCSKLTFPCVHRFRFCCRDEASESSGISLELRPHPPWCFVPCCCRCRLSLRSGRVRQPSGISSGVTLLSTQLPTTRVFLIGCALKFE